MKNGLHPAPIFRDLYCGADCDIMNHQPFEQRRKEGEPVKRNRIRTAAAFLLALALLVCPLRADAVYVNGQWVIFTVANDTLLPLNYATMPTMQNGLVYVPYTVFTDYLGIGSIYNAEENVLVLATPQRTMFFDLKNGTTYDDRDYGFARQAAYINGTIYVPARFTAECFGMTYSYDMDMVRLCNSASVKSDAELKESLADAFAARLEAYQTVPPEEEEEPGTTVPAPAYLMFTGDLNETTDRILDILDRYGLKGMFFLSADAISGNEALVRRLYVDGHRIGLSAANREVRMPLELTVYLNSANAALFRVLRINARDVCMPGGSLNPRYDESWFEALDRAGYRCWDFTVIGPDYLPDAAGDTVRDSVMEALTGAETAQTVVLHSTAAAAEALPQILDAIAESEGEILIPDALTTAVTLPQNP